MAHWNQSRYTLVGVAIGFIFPVLAITSDLLYTELSFSLDNIVLLYEKGPLQWIILTAPVVLGIIFYIMHRITSTTEKAIYSEKLKSDELLSGLGNFLKAIEHGDLTNVRHNVNNPQLDSLLESISLKLKQQKKEEEKVSWVNAGHAKFGELLRATDDLNTLSQQILNNLIDYVKLNQGSVFTYEAADESKEGHLVLQACYAYEKKKYLTQIIEHGQGLVGQCYLERETVVLKRVPQDYVKITSGLGEATPNFVLIVPIKTADHIEGILELAGFKILEDFEIRFIEKTCEAFASVVRNINSSRETKKLLQETQEQTEKLRSQEEEIRQNVEEMQATHEELTRQLNESKVLSERIERRERVMALTTILSEADLKGRIIYANDKFCEVSKFHRDELLGKGHSIVRHPDMPKELFKMLWTTIKRGDVFRGILKNRCKDGTYYWVESTIVPITDETGQIIKYVGSRYHIQDDELGKALYNKQADRFGWSRI